jgi:hypothetical protein
MTKLIVAFANAAKNEMLVRVLEQEILTHTQTHTNTHTQSLLYIFKVRNSLCFMQSVYKKDLEE